MRPTWLVVLVLTAGAILGGTATLLSADSPYDENADVERIPYAPDRPATLNATSAGVYAASYEETILFNDLLASRDHSIDTNDRIRTDCSATNVTEPSDGRYRVALHCTGGIDDHLRPLQPGQVSYRATYAVTDENTTVVAVDGYPLGDTASGSGRRVPDPERESRASYARSSYSSSASP